MKVAILGLAPGCERAPFADDSWEIWCLNDGYLRFGQNARFTRWFELHGDTPLTRARRPADHFDRIAAMDIPVYHLHGDAPAPSAIRLDVEALATVGRDYFTCTFAYQIALALSEGATHIALYGAPLQGNREVVVERPCVSWWLGLAEGRGVSVTVDHDAPLGLLRHPYRYALEDRDERQAAYLASFDARESIGRWLGPEAKRLGLVEIVESA